MVNIDKEKMNENINEAYNNQTEKVKELLESAKKSLTDQKECPYDYSTSKEKAGKLRTVSRVVTKKKENENRIENNINSKFAEMNEKLEINSKNLDFIFQNVINNNKENIVDITDKMQKHIAEAQEEITKQVSEKQANLEVNFKNAQMQAEKKIIKSQIKTQNKMLDSQSKIIERILETKQEKEEKVIEGQRQVKEELIKGQNEVQKAVVEVQNKLEEIKQEIMQSYQKENKHAISTLLEERNSYLKELEEKDKEIRELNYKIYEYEEKLEKEIAKREKFSIFAPFFRKQEVQEEEPIYTSQILNYVCQ